MEQLIHRFKKNWKINFKENEDQMEIENNNIF